MISAREAAMRMLPTAIAVFCGVVTSQVPEFMQQYSQRIGGAIDELRIVVRHFEEDSAQSGYEPGTALQMMARNPERLVRDQGRRMEETMARLNRLREQHAAMKEGGSFAHLGAFLSNLDGPLAQRTWENYVLALSLSVEGVLFFLIGFMMSLMASLLVSMAFRSRVRSEA
jgi:hypothetical protein